MAYLSKSQSFLASKATSLIGRTVVCTYDTGAGYFTKGKEYKIHADDRGGAYLVNNFGGICHASGSMFKLKQLPMTPKQPKVGEVWTFMRHKAPYSTPSSLYHVLKIEDGVVYFKPCAFNPLDHTMKAPIDEFMATNNFVF